MRGEARKKERRTERVELGEAKGEELCWRPSGHVTVEGKDGQLTDQPGLSGERQGEKTY
jgi:hypothetical protein